MEGTSDVAGNYTFGGSNGGAIGAGESVIPRTVYTDDFHDTIKDTLRASPEYEKQKENLELATVPSGGSSEDSFVADETTATVGPSMTAPPVKVEKAEENQGILGKVKEKVLGVAA